MKDYIKIHKMLAIQNVQLFAREKLVAYGKLGEVVGTQIFDILEREKTGAAGRKRLVPSSTESSVSLETSVWDAACELFYLWFESDVNDRWFRLAAGGEEFGDETEETLLASKFVSAFLMDEGVLFREMRRLEIGRVKLDVRDVIRLADRFAVPYRMMVKRLFEVRGCSLKEYEKLIGYKEEQVEMWRRRLEGRK